MNCKVKGAALVLPILEEHIMRMYGLESTGFSGGSDTKDNRKEEIIFRWIYKISTTVYLVAHSQTYEQNGVFHHENSVLSSQVLRCFF